MQSLFFFYRSTVVAAGAAGCSFRRRGPRCYVYQATALGPVLAEGANAGDFNHDGILDIVLARTGGPARTSRRVTSTRRRPRRSR